MNNLDQIKQTLFTATDYADALAKLSAINANVTTYDSYSVIDEFGIVFFATRKNKTLPMVITFDGVSPSVTIDEYYAVHAQQQPDLSQSVPAHDSLAVVGHPFLCDSEVKLVQQYRADNDFNHGYVVLCFLPVNLQDENAFLAEVTGWKLHLDNPQGFVPGVVAVDPNFMCWEAVDGDDYNGAKKWLPLLHEETKQFFHSVGGAA